MITKDNSSATMPAGRYQEASPCQSVARSAVDSSGSSIMTTTIVTKESKVIRVRVTTRPTPIAENTK